MATIYDVAAQAGVSIKTVSRVMNAEPNVRAETRERVHAAAASLNYHPNLSARSLAGSKSYLIAAFVDAKLTIEHWRNERGTDYLARIQLGATMPCREAGYHFLVELVDHNTAPMRQEVSNLLAALKPDGVILTPPITDNDIVLELLRGAGTPYVRLGPEQPDGGGLRLRMDDRAAARGMTDHLVALGHRRIGFIEGEQRYGSSHSRRDGFLESMAAHGLKSACMFVGDYTYQSGIEGGREMLSGNARPTAIFASNDDMALGCMAAAGELGLEIPRDVSIAGFDDSTGSRFSRPQLTTLRQPIVEMAALAACALIAGEVRPDCDEDAHFDFPSFTLVPRLSTARPGKV
ncbi:MAG: LacI family DNA-binding transcriptional regulator [Rhodospirillales bacterium]